MTETYLKTQPDGKGLYRAGTIHDDQPMLLNKGNGTTLVQAITDQARRVTTNVNEAELIQEFKETKLQFKENLEIIRETSEFYKRTGNEK